MNQDVIGLKRVATLCILRNNDKFLLLKRLKEPNKDMYVPVGGKIDPFENPDDAVVREVMEETGIHITSKKFCGILTETSPVKYNWISYVYISDIEFVEPPYCNEGELQWIDAKDLADIPTPLTDLYIYDYVAKGEIFAFNAVYDLELNLISLQEQYSNTIIR
ncbi:NUDIX domain-containing protein [Chryseobacterium sp. G0162]|uniref:NUDIX hydrolase n=1 Tax=Chryseobacterium sp. G0162 TaxID=2487063 RepID=UPI000F4ECA29|nr:NUDIX domain-containing protein [Chryseobacterium sp. G0162]AZB10845.1 NUDIX domain-containing protein [Chryseobacterium sp. G0162]